MIPHVSKGRVGPTLLFGFAIALSALLVPITATHAVTVTDTLDDWKLVEGHSPGLTLDGTNSEYFYHDSSRVKVDDADTVGSFYYHFTDISSFAAFIYYFQGKGSLDVYASPDNVNWTPITYDHTNLTLTSTDPNNGGWASTKISAMLPSGTNYLAFTIHGGAAPQMWTPQIGQVSMDVERIGPSIPGPAGLSVVAAGGHAALAWYPMPSANSYTIKRRSASSEDYHTIASGVTSTTFNDEGLKNGAKYYYAVIADTNSGTTDKSDEVLAVPSAGAVVLADPMADWSLTSAHTPNLDFASVTKNVTCVHRTSATQESFEYNLPGATSFTANVYSTDPQISSNAVTVEASNDGQTWTDVPVSLELMAKASDNTYAAICRPSGKLPAETNYLRFVMGADGVPPDNPSIGQVRIVYGATNPVKTAAAHGAAIHKAQ